MHSIFVNGRNDVDKTTFQKSSDYLAIPVTVNVVLIISDSLLIWSTAARNKLLLWPWMVLHAIEFLFFVAFLIFLMVALDTPWIKVRELRAGRKSAIRLKSTLLCR